MINVQPFHDKIEKLREYMHIKINGHGRVVSINLEALPSLDFDVDKWFWIMNEIGYMIVDSNNPVPAPIVRQLSFEEYCNETSVQC